jgi:hypothetical protein
MAGVIWGFTGNEGGGKSGTMEIMTAIHLNMGGWCETFEGFDVYSPKPGERFGEKHERKLTEQLNIRKWMQMTPDYRNLQIDADEIQNFADSLLSGAVFARLLYRVGAQRRRLNLSLLYTVQNWQWCNPRIRWLTHLLTICQDSFHSPWAKENNVERGHIISATTFDCKGFYTGKPWSVLNTLSINLRPFWGQWASYEPSNIFAGETKYELLKHRERIDLRTADEVHAASLFQQGLLRNRIPDRSEDGISYTPVREGDSFSRGMDAVDSVQSANLQTLDILAKANVDTKTLFKVANLQRKTQALGAVKRK